jgi:NUMOD4 motif
VVTEPGQEFAHRLMVAPATHNPADINERKENSMTEEIWRPVPNFEGRYEVSNRRPIAQVRGVDRVVLRSNGRPQTIRGRTLRQQLGRGGWSVVLSRPGLRQHRFVHKLVASPFATEEAAAA